MKKLISLLFILVIITSITACSENKANVKTAKKDGGVQEILDNAGKTEDTTAPPETETESAKSVTLKSGGKVDVDLTKLNSSMVYSEVNNIVTDPKKYIGKTLRMKGEVDVYKDKETNKTYYSCIIKDATACCANGIEFTLKDGSAYPKNKTQVIVSGVFETYNEGDEQYCRIKDSVIEKS